MKIEETLHDAIGTGELITIIYHGGSQPGATREILPIKITGNKLRARCYTSNAVKTFVIDRIELCPNQTTTASTWDSEIMDFQQFKNIKDVYEQLKKELSSYGWHVKFTESDSGNFVSLSLHTYFKNGKLRKRPAVSLAYDKYTVETIFDEDTGTVTYTEKRKESKRPYRTESRAFGKIDRAVEVFMDKAKSIVPNQEGI